MTAYYNVSLYPSGNQYTSLPYKTREAASFAANSGLMRRIGLIVARPKP